MISYAGLQIQSIFGEGLCGVCCVSSYFEVLQYNGGGCVGMEIDGILDPGMLPMHRSDARIVNVRVPWMWAQNPLPSSPHPQTYEGRNTLTRSPNPPLPNHSIPTYIRASIAIYRRIIGSADGRQELPAPRLRRDFLGHETSLYLAHPHSIRSAPTGTAWAFCWPVSWSLGQSVECFVSRFIGLFTVISQRPLTF